MYESLTSKYRPKNFDEVVGQKYNKVMLANSIKMNKIPQVLLFVGPAGTGKTSFARIVSKYIECQSDKETPCSECPTCLSIAKGTNIDVLELNAADKRKIDDIREVLSKIRFKPKLRYKIVILDEVHMLSVEAFNALLKDLEEPPEYCIFILCTTNPEKIPVTILSRCKTFQFKSITEDEISEHLAYICDNENFKYEEEALKLIAIDSKGGMRDAISSLEQVATFSNGYIDSESVTNMLGIIPQETFDNLMNCLFNKDLDSSVQIVSKLIEDNKSIEKIFLQLQANYGALLKSYFKDKEHIKYSKHELLEICKMFLQYETKMKNSVDKFFVLVNLLNDICSNMTTDINERLSKLEEIIKSGKFRQQGSIDVDRANRINHLLNKKDSDKKTEPKKQEEQEDELFNDFKQLSKGVEINAD